MSYSRLYNRFFNFRERTNNALNGLWHYRPARLYLLLALVWQIIAWLQARFIFKNLSSDLLVLHYNVEFGTDLISQPNQIFYYPLGGLLFILLNLIICLLFYRNKDFKLFIDLLVGGAALFSIFLNLALLSIYLINFR
ncbi:MAG: hypothetical protein ACYC40_01950 [Patescibacteria group bacterium]